MPEVSDAAYNSEFHVYIQIKLLVIRMKVTMGMQIKNSEKNTKFSALDWNHHGADSQEKCHIHSEVKKQTNFTISKLLLAYYHKNHS